MTVDTTSVTLDKKTKELCDKYGKEHSISRSAVIRLAVNEFFIKLGDDL